MNRIERLREIALEWPHNKNELYYRFYKRYHEYAEMGEYERYAEAFYACFAGLTPHISDGELIVGEAVDSMTEAERAEWNETYRAIAEDRCRKAGGGQDSHMAVDYELLLQKGICGILADIDGYLQDCTEEQAAFYRMCKVCLAAIMKHSENYALLAERMATDEKSDSRRRELEEIAAICRRVPAHPAESFYEAVQSVHFLTYCLSLNPFRFCHQQFQLGRPDRYLLPFYEADVARGVLTRERAQLLLDCLGIQINMRVPNGLSSGYLVGGRDADGRCVANELTAMCMQVIDNIRLVYPAVGLCYVDEMPDQYLEQACEILSHGRSHPAIFGDDVIARGLQSYGIPSNDTHSYIHSTCVEITPIAASNVWVASPYTNMAKLLLNTMTREFDSFEDHVSFIMQRIDEGIARNYEAQKENRRVRAKNSINPLLSCFVSDCLSRGVDIEQGGARYNWIMPSFVGMANLVDSLYALKHLVYDRKEMSVVELREILDCNFEGHEDLRLRLLNTLPKYGNDIDEIDTYFSRFTEHIIAECERLSQGDERLIPSVFCWVMHERFGRETGATPDGRPAGFPLGDGSGPCQGRELKGPTASILSSTKWDHARLIGGVAVNMKFSKSSLGAKSLDVMQSLIKAFIRRGGFEMQINVTDKEVLEKARENPAEYRDLVVRIGGYSDYFTKLSPKMQEEVILRTEHRI